MPDRKPPPDDEQPTVSAGGRNDGQSPPLKRIGDFELLRELGRGGMGVVYEARQVSLNRRVALKVLPPGLGLTETAVQRFEREARAAAKLHHTNIVPVHAIGEEEGCHYYAMELIEGQPLSDVLRDLTGEGSNPLLDETVTKLGDEERPASQPGVTTSQEGTSITSLSDSQSGGRKWFDAVAKLIAEVADGLEYAHGRGVIHRDIKPANLMLSRDGKLCVTDFGLARVAQEPGMTVSGSLMGTPAYMSPEQVASGRMKLDHRTDIYSLGAVLYELLTQRRPFPGESREEILGGILTKDPRPPRRFNPRIPVDLETICQKAMEKDPDRRYQNAGEFANDLRQYLQHGLIMAKRAGLPRRVWKSIRRHPVVSSSAIGIIAVLFVGSFALQQCAGRSEQSVQRLIAAAEVDLREGTYRQGLEKIERALAIAPEMPEAIKTRGRLLVQGNSDPRETVRVARAILAEDPDDWEAHGWLAAGWFGDVAVDEHSAALEQLAPDTADAWFARGAAAETDTERLRCYDRALEIDPGHAWAMMRRSEAKRILHQTASAIADANAAIAMRPHSTRGRRFLAAIYLLDLRDIDRALAEFDKAAEIDPEDPHVYLERSWIYRPENRDDRDSRIRELDRALALAPEDYRILRERAFALNSMSRFEEALADAQRSIEIEPHSYTSWNALLWSLWKLERIDELREAFDEFRRLVDGWPHKPSAAEAYTHISFYHRLLGDHEAAVAAAERAVELDSRNGNNYSQLLESILAKAGDSGMVQICDRLQALDLSEPEPLKNRALLLRGVCRRPEAALADLARAVEVAPQWADLYYVRGELRTSRWEYAAAITDFDLAIERAPLWPDPHRLRGNTLIYLKRYDEALASISRAIELAPNHANALFNRANLYSNLERFEEVLTDLDRCFDLIGGPRAPALYARWMQAVALARLGREEEALEAVDLAVANHPNSDEAIRFRVQLSMMLGRADEALEHAERAVEQSQQNAWNYLHRARTILHGDGDCDRALADLATARELAPEDPAVASELAWVQALLVDRRCPERFDRDLAFDLARMGVDDNANDADRQLNYGLALYRLGRFREARDALRLSAELRSPQPEPTELFPLAKAEWKLGNKAEARNHYGGAVARMNETWPRFPEYIFLKEEAAELLGIEP